MLKKLCIIAVSLSFMLSMLVGCHYTIDSTNDDINSDGSINSKQLSKNTVEVHEKNGLYHIYVDNETGVLYLSNGTGLTPMYNADGTLKTVEQKE